MSGCPVGMDQGAYTSFRSAAASHRTLKTDRMFQRTSRNGCWDIVCTVDRQVSISLPWDGEAAQPIFSQDKANSPLHPSHPALLAVVSPDWESRGLCQ